MSYKKTGDAGNGGGTAPTDTDDFIFSKFQPFAEDQGFVANQAPAVGSSPNRELWTHQGTVGTPAAPYVYIRTRDTVAFCMTGTGINASEEIFDQPGNPANGPDFTAFPDPGTGQLNSSVRCPVLKGQSTAWSEHHLFSNAAGDYIHGVVKLADREWRHIWYGKMPDANKYGTWDGGSYCFAHWWNYTSGNAAEPISNTHFGPGLAGSDGPSGGPQRCGFFHCENLVTGAEWFIPTFNNENVTTSETYNISKFVGGVNNSAYAVGACFLMGAQYSFGASPQIWGTSLIARTTPLIPITVAAKYDYGGNIAYTVLGTLPDVFWINMENYSAGESITIGSDTYVVFPITNNDTTTTTTGEPYSGYFGLAYKVIT